MQFVIRRITSIDPIRIEPLVLASEAEGYRHVRHLVNAWADGSERFERSGEALFGVFVEDLWVGTGGLTLDPFNPGPENGRVRRMYVHPDVRGHGIGKALLAAILAAANGRFTTLHLYTENPTAARMYEAAGFEGVEAEKVTHRKTLEIS